MMLRPASRLLRLSPLHSIPRVAPSRRLLSTAPPSQKSRSFKNKLVRLALAGGVVYFYNTTDIFAEEPSFVPRSAEYESEPENLPTLEALATQRKQQRAKVESRQDQSNAQPAPVTGDEHASGGEPNGIEQLEEEAGQQGAFNPETGEINWDCPCLGGMAHGPCGEEFKTAFSCFVFSEADPKGMDCIDKFQGMQTCFRKYPEIYGSELEDDDEDEQQAQDKDGSQTRPDPETTPDTLALASKDDTSMRTSTEQPKYTVGEKVADRGQEYTSSHDSAIKDKRAPGQVAHQIKDPHSKATDDKS
ncbi:hypothetical protein EJ05DRAFT_461078 [Pseudovirgaria hyperparasitica]|uniref:Mitochondrial intermembrane space import and assembly protein 40 n=1 Tax=Pseudovirgaria hyperparasitica TaxID=470096 RepID=A0A6A6WIY9_9PEZI|nr:uncharacterized protein EJ05DRAFT_461078 [Pseudovirgaria hyperparasitica]KAF2762319.1 hypothetical protein EJ05DRAFT_461078 [Pseudovirgaria hyperparasitica]